MEGSPKLPDDLDFQLFDLDDIEFMNNVDNIMNNQQNEISANFPKDPTFAEASNMPTAPVNDLTASLTRDAQPQLGPTNDGPDTFGFGNVSHNSSNPLHAQVDQLVSSPDGANESIFGQSSSNLNPEQPIYSGFEGNGSSLGLGDAYQTASPLFSPLIMETTNSFPLALAERFSEDGSHSIPLFHSEQEANLVQTDQVNRHIRSNEELAQNSGYSTQPFRSEHGFNSVQTNEFNGHIGSAKNVTQNGVYSTQPFHSEHGISSVQTNQVNDLTRLVTSHLNQTKEVPQNGGYSTQPFHSEHVVNSVQANQVNGRIGMTEQLSHNRGYTTQPFHSEHVVNSVQTNQVNGRIGMTEQLSHNRSYMTQPFHSEQVVNSVKTSRNGPQENIPQNESYLTRPFHSEQGVNLVRTNQVNDHIGSSLQTELLGSQRVEPSNLGKATTLADQVQQNNGNNNFNNSHQELPYSNSFTQSSSGTGYYLHGGSRQINQQAPNGVSYKDNDLYRPLAPPGQQFVRFQATSNSDPQRYNLVQPRPSASLRPQQLNNPGQLINQVPNMPNAPNSLLQQSMSTRPGNFSDQNDQFSMAPGAYNPQTYRTRLAESSIPSRTPIRLPPPQINPLGVSNFQYLNSLQSKPPTTLPSGGFMSEGLNEQRHHQFDPFNPMTNQFGTHSSNSMLQDSPMHSGSYRMHDHRQASSQFSMMPGLPNSDHHSYRPQQQQGLLNQTATYPSLSSTILNSLLHKEIGDTSAPYQMEASQSGRREGRTSGRRRGGSRRRLESGESSSSSSSLFKRFRRDTSLPNASSAQQENRNFLYPQNGIGTSSNTSTSLLGPRPIKNSVYDPIYEGIGLPIDPHLRLFATI